MPAISTANIERVSTSEFLKCPSEILKNSSPNCSRASQSLVGDYTIMHWIHTYDPTNNLLSEVNLISADGNNTTYTYAYDSYQGLDSVSEDNPYARFVTGYTYGPENLIASERITAVDKSSNTIAQAMAGEIDNFWDGVKAFGTGAAAGALVGTGIAAGLGVPILGTAIKAAGWAYAGITAASAVHGINVGINTGDWSNLANTGKLFLGNFYLDSNRDFGEQLLQGTTRFSWEGLQSLVGYGYSNVRNVGGSVSRVDYFGGATFATNEYSTERDGISLGNFININMRDRIVGNFADHVVSDPLFMHEYGHTFDSQRWGLGYLFGIGIPSGISSLTSKPIQGEPVGVNTHSFRWYEMSANRRAARYFGKYYGVDWNRPYREGTYETYYPRRRR